MQSSAVPHKRGNTVRRMRWACRERIAPRARSERPAAAQSCASDAPCFNKMTRSVIAPWRTCQTRGAARCCSTVSAVGPAAKNFSYYHVALWMAHEGLLVIDHRRKVPHRASSMLLCKWRAHLPDIERRKAGSTVLR